MIRVVLFLGIVCLAALGIVWLADRPGEVAITWLGWRIETSVMVLIAAAALLAAVFLLAFSFLRGLWRSPRRLLIERNPDPPPGTKTRVSRTHSRPSPPACCRRRSRA